SGPLTGARNQPAFLNAHIERIGEDVNRIEADFLGHADAVSGVASGLRPCGIDESQFHALSSLAANGPLWRLDSGRSAAACPAPSAGLEPHAEKSSAGRPRRPFPLGDLSP